MDVQSDSVAFEIDFHSLARRELQALCKKNKIPANITNVAMADALKALEKVEGLEEFLTQRESNDFMPESPYISQTATKTATRRKPIPSARKLVTDELSQDNKDGNVPLTPAVQTGRRRAPVGSTIRKVEEATVQHGYSTRRSVRLLEKGMDQLSLNEAGKIEPVKMGMFDNDVKEQKNEITEAKDDTEQDNVGGVVKTEVADQAFVPIDVKGKNYNEETHVSDDILSEKSDNTAEINDASIDEKVADEVVKKDLEAEKLNLNTNEDSPAQVFDTESTLKPENPSEEESNSEDDKLVISEVNHVNEGPKLEFSAEKSLDNEKDESFDENSSDEEDSYTDDDMESDQEANPQLEFSVERSRNDEKSESLDENSSDEEDSNTDDDMESDQEEDIQTEGHLDTKIEPSEDSEDWENETEASEDESKTETHELPIENSGVEDADKISVSELNKENIEKDETKKTGVTEDLSLRQLTKMLKQKLEITNKAKNADDKNVSKDPEVKARVALEKLPENHMRIAETEGL